MPRTKPKNNKMIQVTFILQIADDLISVIKSGAGQSGRELIEDAVCEKIPSDLSDSKVAESLAIILGRLKFNNNNLILCLPRSQATCRYLKIPSRDLQEIEKITNLQASRFLPYPQEELISGFELIESTPDGYSVVNQAIVHKDTIDKYIRILKEAKVKKINILLSSFGIVQIFNYFSPDASNGIVIDIDAQAVEFCMVKEKKLLFSRSVRLIRSSPAWIDLFMIEINKTVELYKKETENILPERVYILDALTSDEEERIKSGLKKEIVTLPYKEKFKINQKLDPVSLAINKSFAGLIGLALGAKSGFLSLLPQDLKEKIKKADKFQEQIKFIGMIICFLLLLGLAIAKDIDNKNKYIFKLKEEINKISLKAQPLEDIEKRMRALNSHFKKGISPLAIIYEINQVLPDNVTLSSLIYSENNQVMIRGLANELNDAVAIAASLEKNPVFKGFNIKINYATKKKIQGREVVDFEIACTKFLK